MEPVDGVLARSTVQRYERPSDVIDAHRLLVEVGDAARLVGGGTDLALHMPPGVTTLIDLARLPLWYIERRDGHVAVGATTTLTAMARDPAVAGLAGGLLGTVLAQLGSPALRNVASIGGHVARGRLSDLVPALLVLDAEVVMFDGDERVVPLTELYAPDRNVGPVLITEVRLPVPEPPAMGGFIRFSRTAFDYPVLNCAVTLHAPGTVDTARVAVGETPALARRVPEIEQFLAGRGLDDDTIAAAASLAQDVVRTGDDQRASGAYRRALVGVGLRRALLMAAGRPEVEP